MKLVGNLCGWIEKLLAVLCVTGFIVMFALGVATVFFRFVVESSLAFPEELIRYLFVWMTALGSAVAFRRNSHAAIGIIVDNLPGILKRFGLLIATTATGIFALILIYQGFHLTSRVVPQISPALEISMAWVYAAVPVGGLFLLIFAVEMFLQQSTASDAELVAGSQ